MTLEENRQALIQALRKDANLHEKGLFSQLGNDFDQLDVETTGIFEDVRVRFGLSQSHRLLVVAHTIRDSKTRIISARLMTRQEKVIYAEG